MLLLAAGGFGLVFPEQIAIMPDGRTGTRCAGIYDESQMEGHARLTAIVSDMGAVPAIQLGHTGRRGSETKPWEGKIQLPPDDPDGWQVRGPSPIPYGGKHTYPVRELPIEEIAEIHRAYAAAAKRAYEAGYRWLELHFAHGYLGASFFSPLANQRTDAYGGSREKRLRFHREALDAVQRELREYDGVSVLIYDQVCATEKRRRRRRGTMAQADRHVEIDAAVCENCGDCSTQSGCTRWLRSLRNCTGDLLTPT